MRLGDEQCLDKCNCQLFKTINKFDFNGKAITHCALRIPENNKDTKIHPSTCLEGCHCYKKLNYSGENLDYENANKKQMNIYYNTHPCPSPACYHWFRN